jgi:hypothetical protein
MRHLGRLGARRRDDPVTPPNTSFAHPGTGHRPLAMVRTRPGRPATQCPPGTSTPPPLNCLRRSGIGPRSPNGRYGSINAHSSSVTSPRAIPACYQPCCSSAGRTTWLNYLQALGGAGPESARATSGRSFAALEPRARFTEGLVIHHRSNDP